MSAWYEDTDNNGPVRANLLYEPGVFCTVNLTCAKSTDVEFSFEAGMAYCAAIALLRLNKGGQ